MELFKISVVALLWACSVVQAQDPAVPPQPPAPVVLEYTGKPIVLPFQCTDEDLRASGLSCSEEEPCAVFLELTLAGSIGSRILAAGNLHAEAVTLYSVLLASDDGGRTWLEAHERLRSATFDHVQFHGTDKAWISGQELAPLSQNPFILVTSDGGKTWRRRPIFSESSESRFGSVQQFYFSDKDVGSLIVDRGQGGEGGRYVLYESPDGGDTWLIKQESATPIAVKMPSPVSADWRIRVDAPSKSFHVERRQGERWSSVAAFQVKVEPCKGPKPADDGVKK